MDESNMENQNLKIDLTNFFESRNNSFTNEDDLLNLLFKEIYLKNEINFNNSRNSRKYFLLIYSNKLLIISIKDSTIKVESEYSIPIIEKSLAHCLFINKIYLIYSLNSVYMLDKDLMESIKVKHNEKDLIGIELCKDNSYIFYDNKFFFTGGINHKGKISDQFLTYDISTYNFENEKIRENNMIPRFKHGMIDIAGYIYLIGGFTKTIENEENICNKIQVIKYDNYLNTWFDLEIEGDTPELLISPICKIFKENYIVVFSDFKYFKFWCVDLNTKKSKMIKLNENLFVDFKKCLDFSFDIDKNEVHIFYLNVSAKLKNIANAKIPIDFI